MATSPWLSKAALRNAAQLIDLGKAKGAKRVTVLGATFDFPYPQSDQRAAAVANVCGRKEQHTPPHGVRKERGREAAAPPADAAPSDVRRAPNQRARRSAQRLQDFQDAKKRLHCKLRPALVRAVPVAARIFRWKRMQDVWTAWKRQELAAAATEARMTEAPAPAEKRARESPLVPCAPEQSPLEILAETSSRQRQMPPTPLPSALPPQLPPPLPPSASPDDAHGWAVITTLHILPRPVAPIHTARSQPPQLMLNKGIV